MFEARPAARRQQRDDDERIGAAPHARPEQAARSEQQHQDEHEEDADLAERLPEIETAQALHHADQQAADQRAGHRAHAAQHHDGEGDQHEGVADVRIDVIGRDQQARRDREAGRAEAEGHGIDVRDVDAGRARRPASPSPPRGLPCRYRSRLRISQSTSATATTTTKAMTARHREEGDAEIDDLEGVRQVDGARVGAKRVEERILDHDREPERDQQDVAVLAARGRPDDEALQAVAEREKQRASAEDRAR